MFDWMGFGVFGRWKGRRRERKRKEGENGKRSESREKGVWVGGWMGVGGNEWIMDQGWIGG